MAVFDSVAVSNADSAQSLCIEAQGDLGGNVLHVALFSFFCIFINYEKLSKFEHPLK